MRIDRFTQKAQEALQEAQQLAGELGDRFREEYGSIRCVDVQTSIFGRSFNFRDPADAQAFGEAGGYEKCPEVARKAAMLAAEIILRERREG